MFLNFFPCVYMYMQLHMQAFSSTIILHVELLGAIEIALLNHKANRFSSLNEHERKHITKTFPFAILPARKIFD